MTDSIVPVNSARTALSASSPIAMAILIACLNQLFSFSCFSSFSQLSVGPPSLNSRMTGAYAPVWLFKYSLRESFLSSSLQAAPKSVTPPAFRSFQITSPIAIGPLCGVIHEQPLLNCMMATLISASSFAALISGKSLVMASSIALLTLPILLPHILPEVSTNRDIFLHLSLLLDDSRIIRSTKEMDFKSSANGYNLLWRQGTLRTIRQIYAPSALAEVSEAK